MPSIEAKASTKRVETSNVKNKTLVKVTTGESLQ